MKSASSRSGSELRMRVAAPNVGYPQSKLSLGNMFFSGGSLYKCINTCTMFFVLRIGDNGRKELDFGPAMGQYTNGLILSCTIDVLSCSRQSYYLIHSPNVNTYFNILILNKSCKIISSVALLKRLFSL